YGDHRDLHSFPTRRSSDLEIDSIVSDVSLAVIRRSSLLTPGSSAITLIRSLSFITSIKGSRCSLTENVPPKGPGNELIFPNFRTTGFPSSPIFTEYPYTIGPVSLTIDPSSSLLSLTRFLGTCWSIFFSASCINFSISLIILSTSGNQELGRLRPNHSSNGDDIDYYSHRSSRIQNNNLSRVRNIIHSLIFAILLSAISVFQKVSKGSQLIISRPNRL